MRTGYLIAGSVVLHVGVFALVSHKAKEIEQKQTLIEVVEQQKKEEQKKAEPPPKPVEAAAEVLAPKQLAPSPSPAPEVNQTPSPQMQALPDVGAQSSSSNSGAGGNGTAPVGDGTGGNGGGGGGTGEGKPVEKNLSKPGSVAATDQDLAAEIAAWKPKLTARVNPVYPDGARGSEIEGTVIVELVVDCHGKVASAKVAKGLGHGLDEAALTAARKSEFGPAPRCAPGFQKSMKINYAFRLGD